MSLNLLSLISAGHLNQLDWEILLAKIASHLHFQSCQAKIRDPAALRVKAAAEIEEQYDSLDFFRSLLQEEDFGIFFSALTRIDGEGGRDHLPAKVRKSQVLDLAELNELAKYLESFL